MKKTAQLVLFLALLLVIVPASSIAQRGENDAAQKPSVLAITHVTVIDVANNTELQDQTVLIASGKITAVSAAEKATVPADATTVDGHGKFLIPGLWDMHVHLAGVSTDAHWSQPLLGVLLAHGITAVRDMGGNLPDLQYWRTEIAAGRMAGPLIYASGPMLSGSENKMPTQLAADTPLAAQSSAAMARNMGADFIKILNGLTHESYLAVAQFSKDHNIPFVGHVPYEVSASEASDAGQKSIEHMDGIQLACSAKEEDQRKAVLDAQKHGDITAMARLRSEILASFDQKKCEALFAKFKQNGTWQTPTQVWTRTISTLDKATLDRSNASDPYLKYLPASVSSEWTSEKIDNFFPSSARAVYASRFEQGKKFVKMMNTAGVGLLAGSDSLDPYVFPGPALHDELALFVDEGLTPAQALATATVNPAKFFARDDLGTIAAGKSADLVLLNADPLKDIRNTMKIEAVVRAGKLFTRTQLDKLLDDARKAAAIYKPM